LCYADARDVPDGYQVFKVENPFFDDSDVDSRSNPRMIYCIDVPFKTEVTLIEKNRALLDTDIYTFFSVPLPCCHTDAPVCNATQTAVYMYTGSGEGQIMQITSLVFGFLIQHILEKRCGIPKDAIRFVDTSDDVVICILNTAFPEANSIFLDKTAADIQCVINQVMASYGIKVSKEKTGVSVKTVDMSKNTCVIFNSNVWRMPDGSPLNCLSRKLREFGTLPPTRSDSYFQGHKLYQKLVKEFKGLSFEEVMAINHAEWLSGFIDKGCFLYYGSLASLNCDDIVAGLPFYLKPADIFQDTVSLLISKYPDSALRFLENRGGLPCFAESAVRGGDRKNHFQHLVHCSRSCANDGLVVKVVDVAAKQMVSKEIPTMSFNSKMAHLYGRTWHGSMCITDIINLPNSMQTNVLKSPFNVLLNPCLRHLHGLEIDSESQFGLCYYTGKVNSPNMSSTRAINDWYRICTTQDQTAVTTADMINLALSVNDETRPECHLIHCRSSGCASVLSSPMVTLMPIVCNNTPLEGMTGKDAIYNYPNHLIAYSPTGIGIIKTNTGKVVLTRDSVCVGVLSLLDGSRCTLEQEDLVDIAPFITGSVYSWPEGVVGGSTILRKLTSYVVSMHTNPSNGRGEGYSVEQDAMSLEDTGAVYGPKLFPHSSRPIPISACLMSHRREIREILTIKPVMPDPETHTSNYNESEQEELKRLILAFCRDYHPRVSPPLHPSAFCHYIRNEATHILGIQRSQGDSIKIISCDDQNGRTIYDLIVNSLVHQAVRSEPKVVMMYSNDEDGDEIVQSQSPIDHDGFVPPKLVNSSPANIKRQMKKKRKTTTGSKDQETHGSSVTTSPIAMVVTATVGSNSMTDTPDEWDDQQLKSALASIEGSSELPSKEISCSMQPTITRPVIDFKANYKSLWASVAKGLPKEKRDKLKGLSHTQQLAILRDDLSEHLQPCILSEELNSSSFNNASWVTAPVSREEVSPCPVAVMFSATHQVPTPPFNIHAAVFAPPCKNTLNVTETTQCMASANWVQCKLLDKFTFRIGVEEGNDLSIIRSCLVCALSQKMHRVHRYALCHINPVLSEAHMNEITFIKTQSKYVVHSKAWLIKKYEHPLSEIQPNQSLIGFIPDRTQSGSIKMIAIDPLDSEKLFTFKWINGPHPSIEEEDSTGEGLIGNNDLWCCEFEPRF
jgi:hypothetical protein